MHYHRARRDRKFLLLQTVGGDDGFNTDDHERGSEQQRRRHPIAHSLRLLPPLCAASAMFRVYPRPLVRFRGTTAVDVVVESSEGFSPHPYIASSICWSHQFNTDPFRDAPPGESVEIINRRIATVGDLLRVANCFSQRFRGRRACDKGT